MHHFHYKKNELFCEEVSLKEIARKVGTPSYVYSQATLTRHFNAYMDPLKGHDHLVCFSVKANSNLSILRLLARLGAGFDIVSGGELFRVLKAGGNPKKVVFSGVGKTVEEMRYALKKNILSFNVESAQELETLNSVAKYLKTKAPVSLRVNPDIDPKTHPYISTGLKENKFGIPLHEALKLYRNAKQYTHIAFIGIDSHIGSQMLSLEPILESVRALKKIIIKLRKSGIEIRHLNIGGGLGIPYSQENPPSPQEYLQQVLEELKELNIKLLLEPGRTIVGNAGILLTKVLYTKDTASKHFVIVDSAMNDLIRPTLYDAHHEIWPIQKRSLASLNSLGGLGMITADIVGPICESGDFFAKDRNMEESKRGDLLAIMSAGAYGFSMASNYNSRLRAAEVLVSGNKFKICRTREKRSDLIRGER